jgi:mercuric ion transport protein
VKQRTRIELVYDTTCPNVERARAAIRAALLSVGEPMEWQEWERGADATPAALRGLGSPSVLVNGRDVGCDEGTSAGADANSCRIYTDESGCLCGAPAAGLIVDALKAATKS